MKRLLPRIDRAYRWDVNASFRHWRGGTLLTQPVKWGPFTFHPHRYGIGTLMRFSVRLPGGRKVMLHHFQPHRELAWHNHPWDFRTIILAGGYTDESLHEEPDGPYQGTPYIVADRLRWLSVRRRPAEHTHRTSSKRGALTLVLTQPSRREWCHSGEDDTRIRADWTCQP